MPDATPKRGITASNFTAVGLGGTANPLALQCAKSWQHFMPENVAVFFALSARGLRFRALRFVVLRVFAMCRRAEKRNVACCTA